MRLEVKDIERVKSTSGGKTLSCTAALDDVFMIKQALRFLVNMIPVSVFLYIQIVPFYRISDCWWNLL